MTYSKYFQVDRKVNRMVFHALLALFLLPLPLRAAGLSGFVADRETGEALPSATAFIADTGLGALSDARGYYSIQGIPSGTFVVTFSYIGYQNRQDTLIVAGREDLRLDVDLTPEPIALEEETVVRAERSAAEREVQTSFFWLISGLIQGPPATLQPSESMMLRLIPSRPASRMACITISIHSGVPNLTGPLGTIILVIATVHPLTPTSFIASRSAVTPSLE